MSLLPVTPMPGLRTASQEEIHTPLETVMPELMLPIQESVLPAKDSLRLRAERMAMSLLLATLMPGLRIASQEETHTLLVTEMQELTQLIQVLESSAKVLHRSRARVLTLLKLCFQQEEPMLGLMTANQEETHTLLEMEMQELTQLILALVFLAKVLLRLEAEKNQPQLSFHLVETMLGLTNAIQLRTPLPRRTQVVLELMKKARRDHSQALASTAKDSLRSRVKKEMLLKLSFLQEEPMLGLMTASQVEIHTQPVMEMPELMLPTQESVSTAKVSPKREDAQPVSQSAMEPMASKESTAAERLGESNKSKSEATHSQKNS